MFSCLGPGTLRELRDLYRAEGWPTPTPGYIDMHDLGDMLVEAGFAEPVLDQETITLRWRSATALLAELRQLGGNTAPDRFPGLRTRVARSPLAASASAPDADGSIGPASKSPTVTASSLRRACVPTHPSQSRSTKCGRWCAGRVRRREAVR